jgi:hypothetical protein
MFDEKQGSAGNTDRQQDSKGGKLSADGRNTLQYSISVRWKYQKFSLIPPQQT